MESQHAWPGDSEIINLWERVGITYLGEAPRAWTSTPVDDLALVMGDDELPISLDDYLVEHRMKPDATTIDELTVRQALMMLGLSRRAHRYPEWVGAEAWLFVALRIERRITAVEILARAHDLGLSQSAIDQARVRLGVITTCHPGGQHGERWQLPPAIAEHGTPADVDPRWRRFQHASQPCG